MTASKLEPKSATATRLAPTIQDIKATPTKMMLQDNNVGFKPVSQDNDAQVGSGVQFNLVELFKPPLAIKVQQRKPCPLTIGVQRRKRAPLTIRVHRYKPAPLSIRVWPVKLMPPYSNMMFIGTGSMLALRDKLFKPASRVAK